MLDLQATIEIAVELERFHNIDLFQRGYVSKRMKFYTHFTLCKTVLSVNYKYLFTCRIKTLIKFAFNLQKHYYRAFADRALTYSRTKSNQLWLSSSLVRGAPNLRFRIYWRTYGVAWDRVQCTMSHLEERWLVAWLFRSRFCADDKSAKTRSRFCHRRKYARGRACADRFSYQITVPESVRRRCESSLIFPLYTGNSSVTDITNHIKLKT